jgi:hypothetical protein
VAKLQGVEAKSPDGDLALEGEVTLRDPVAMSTVNAYLRFKLSDSFLKQAANVATILQMAGAQGKRPDGFYGLRLSGRLGQLNPPILSPTSPLGTSSAPSPRPGTRASITPTNAPFKLPPSAPVPAPPSMAMTPPMPPPAPEAPPPPPPPPPSPAPASSPTGGWHGGASAPVVAEAGAPPAPDSPPPPPPPPPEQVEPPQ